MSRVVSIAKNLSSSFTSHVVSVVYQLALIPLFISRYGASGLGEWLTLSASVAYLGSMDFGIQTFVNQDLTVRYHRGDMLGFHVNQSTALRMLLGIVVAAGLLAGFSFFMPIEHWLKMDGTSSAPKLAANVVRGTVFIMALQVLIGIILGFFTGQFMVLGRAHVGGYWTNAKNLLTILVAVPFVMKTASFEIVALAQLGATFACTIGAAVNLYQLGPTIFPRLRYWDSSIVGSILKPSGYFALIFSCNFLVYQVPVVILARSAGPIAVAVFAVSRTIFSMTRNVLNGLTQAVGPEVTKLYAVKDWVRLGVLYDYSERFLFAIIPVANITTLMLCPFLLTIWLHKPQLFDQRTYLIFAAISLTLATKEHKVLFLFSTNNHRMLARVQFCGYVLLVGLWSVFVPHYGIYALLICWMLIECCQLAYIVRLNRLLFEEKSKVDSRYLFRLVGISVFLLLVSSYFMSWSIGRTIPTQVAFACAGGLTILVVNVRLFTLRPVWSAIRVRIATRRSSTV